jgi:hypothetical protein
MRRTWLLAIFGLALALRGNSASACACCGAKFRRIPVGWTDAGGAILLDAYDNEACEHKRRLEIWPIGAKAPSGCFDLYGDPEKRIPCEEISWGKDKQPKTSSKTTLFPKPAVKLDPKKVRTTQRRIENDSNGNARVTVELDHGGWRRVWSGTISVPEISTASASVSVWPNARGDRAMLLVEYVRGSNQAVDVHWIELR